ncbi:MAG TPA: NAD-binding protein [Bryobacteraceae bacterium]|nr:NAD-binding protein [Bryobacteraceae bacterium]
MPHVKRRLAFIAAAIALTLSIGTTGFVLIEHYPLFDAFYMSLITVTTVGYQEVHPLHYWGRLFNSFLIFFGVSTMLLAVGAMTQTIIELELSHFFEKRQVKRMVEKLNGHYIICGYGRVGRGAAAELQRAEVPFIVLETDEGKVTRAMKTGMLAALGDATKDMNLREVGIARAAGLIATLSTDADNLFLVMSAKTLNPKLKISARVLEEDSEQKLRRAGADSVLAPFSITGSRLAQAILRPHVVQFLDFTTMNMGLNVSIEQVRVSEHSEYVSKSLGQMQLRREVGVIVLAIKKADGTMKFNPDAEAEISGGDFLIAMGDPAQLKKLDRILTEVND